MKSFSSSHPPSQGLPWRNLSPHRTERARLTHSVPRMAASRCRAVPGYPWPFRVRGVGTPVSGPFPSHGPAHATRAFPRTGPGGPGSPPSTVLCLRYDPLHGVPSTYFFASRYHASPADSLPLPRRQGRARTFCFRRGSVFRRSHADRAGSPRFPSEPSRGYADVLRPRPIRQLLASSGAADAAPAERTTKASTIRISWLNSVASPPAVYASRHALPHAMQHALPAGRLGLCRAGVEPAGSR